MSLPRRNNSGSADSQEQRINVANKPTNVGVYRSPINDIETRRGLNIAGTPIPAGATSPMQVGKTPQQTADEVLSALDGLNFPSTKPSGGGSGVNPVALQAIATLRQRLDQPSETDALQARLAEIYKQAEDRINTAGADMSSRLSTPMPQTQFAPAMQVAPVAMANYLQSIGASGADVTAQQNLSNALLSQIASNAQQYGQGISQANDVVRNAIASAVPANQLAGISQASLNRAAYEAQLASQKSNERKTIQDQILELALKYGIQL